MLFVDYPNKVVTRHSLKKHAKTAGFHYSEARSKALTGIHWTTWHSARVGWIGRGFIERE